MTTTADVLGGRAAWSCEAADALSWLRGLPADCVHCCVTSPPYFGLRDYGVSGQLGLEATPAEYVEKMVAVFREVRRVLHPSGTLWLNIGSSYAGGGRGNYCSEDSEQATNVGANIPAVRTGDANEPFALRDDLTPDEVAYVLSELASVFREGGEVG